MSLPEPDILAIQRRYRAALMAGDAQAKREIAHAYATAWQAVDRRLQELLEQIEARRAAGRPVDFRWLYGEQHLRVLLATIETEMARVSATATAQTIRKQEQAVQLALDQAAETIRATAANQRYARRAIEYISTQRTDPASLQHLVGTLHDGSPLRDLFDALGDTASADARAVLTAAVATGQHPTVTARQMRDAFGGNLSRALTVARTETLRSYRTASHETYREPEVSQVLQGWVWIASLSSTTCASCLAMHGSIHPLSEEFGSHPSCRCSPAPRAKGSRVTIEAGADWFARQDEAIQRRILGPGGYDAYQSGRITLGDLVKTTYSPQWGTTRTVRPLRELVSQS